ncbi:hypothetical protein WICPIJ_000459 [Wickerhamomyces pijperi]|uniref:25S rRNA (Uridine(2843)-N(3))-methyltransferase n=1 Tax=Wickerhamomyces pijperi TaxID=599730 RepID=A0A9P8QCQ7_WICPI|nr:hypothetical protein WICPIJ_000459 [Wickerhamomyces pijperi]
MSRRIERSIARRELLRAEYGDSDDEDYEISETPNTIPSITKHSLPPRDILKLFYDSFHLLFDSPDLEKFIQSVKTELYNREYLAAFDNDDKRMAYCCRWSPSRALAYTSLFGSLIEVRELIQSQEANVLLIGGGAGAELAAVCSVLTKAIVDNDASEDLDFNIDLFDIADWSRITNKLSSEIRKTWFNNKYQDEIKINFKNHDILNHSTDFSTYNFISLLFTTNELFKEDKKKSLQFFQQLNQTCEPGTLLLITESAGSYSHIEIGTKKFPIQFLIDTILLGKHYQKNPDDGDWELVRQTDSCWYRVGNDPNEYSYPLKLENMRFFFRLYRKK